MAENEPQADSTAPEPVKKDKAPRIAKIDPFLELMTHIVNSVDTRGEGFVSVTVQVHGVLVSGMLASGRGFFAAQKKGFIGAWNRAVRADDVSNPVSNETTRVFEELFEGFENNYPSNSEPMIGRPMPEYIHLAKAKFFLSNGEPMSSPQGIWWRCRLSAVDAFFLGTMDTEPPSY